MYLSKISIQNYRGIKNLEIYFDRDINIIIGENASCKTAVIDALRLFYSLGEQQRNIWVSKDDFYLDTSSLSAEEKILLSYEFKGLSDQQKGALYEYLVLDEKEDYAKITLIYVYDENHGKVRFTYYSGESEGQKPDSNTFDLFQHYHLGALRDSTKDLLIPNKSILGSLLKRVIERDEKQEEYESLMEQTNEALLEKPEIKEMRKNINENLNSIFKQYPENQIGLNLEQSKLEYIVNIIKPFLPHDRSTLEGRGFTLWQNSLGFNNLIYIATVLGDIKDRISSELLNHCALFIEEPEAHLHPQLQLSLYNFLSSNSTYDNSQLFVTTHSSTLTSKVPLKHLILLKEQPYKIANCFSQRESENIKEGTDRVDYKRRRKQLERYFDVTRSQLLFSRGILLVEGISEELLIPIFCQILGYSLEDYRIELVNVDGTSFYPFLHLFNSSDTTKRLPIPVSILTDDDRFTGSKEYKFVDIMNDKERLEILRTEINNGTPCTRIANLNSTKNNIPEICVSSAFKTFEFEITRHNVNLKKEEFENNDFIRYFKKSLGDKYSQIKTYIDGLDTDSEGNIEDEEKEKVAILLWKAIPNKNKAEFSQDLSVYLSDKLKKKEALNFNIPQYIIEALSNLTNDADGTEKN